VRDDRSTSEITTRSERFTVGKAAGQLRNSCSVATVIVGEYFTRSGQVKKFLSARLLVSLGDIT
jgi:hypothetical protein